MNKQCNECSTVYAQDWDYCPLCGYEEADEAFDLVSDEVKFENLVNKYEE